MHLLGLDFPILLNVNVVIGLEDANFVVGEFDREAFNQGKLMLDHST